MTLTTNPFDLRQLFEQADEESESQAAEWVTYGTYSLRTPLLGSYGVNTVVGEEDKNQYDLAFSGASTVWPEDIRDLHQEIAALKVEIKHLRDQLAVLPHASTIVPISTLAPEPFKLIKPFYAVLQQDGDGFIASFFDANISASGETDIESVGNLKEVINPKL